MNRRKFHRLAAGRKVSHGAGGNAERAKASCRCDRGLVICFQGCPGLAVHKGGAVGPSG
jgi:hypothetical protein